MSFQKSFEFAVSDLLRKYALAAFRLSEVQFSIMIVWVRE